MSKISTKYPNRSFDYIDKFKVEIESLYKQGNSIRAIAQQLSLSKSTVGDYIRKLGISRNDFNGDKNPFYGKKHSAEFCEKISKQNSGKPCVNVGKSIYPSSKYVYGPIIKKWQHEAEKRDIEWSITLDEIDILWERQQGCCALSGRLMDGMTYKANKFQKVSLDRINYKLSYTFENCQLVLGVVNLSKHILNNEEFISLCKSITEYSHVNG